MQKTIYFVHCEPKNDCAVWDLCSGIFPTHDEALASAERDLRYWTDREKRMQIITVNHADVDISDDASLDDAYNAIMESGGGWYVDHILYL